MNAAHSDLLRPLLRRQFAWVTTLHWHAGGAMIAFDIAQSVLGPYFEPVGLVAGAGAVVLLLNAALYLGVRRLGNQAGRGRWLPAMAWTQLVADLAALTLVVLATGGLRSPALGFFVIPPIFASLFLSRVQAYGAALLAIALFTFSLGATGSWPDDGLERMTAIGWILTMFFAVHLVNRVTRGIFRRETHRLRQERRLREANDRLDAQEQAMRQHEKLVSVGQLAAGVAHEISNPLASMDGLLQLMQRSPDKPRPEAITRLREQIARISATLRQMTTLGHPDLGEPEPVDPNALIRDTIEILGYDRRLREVDIRLDLEQDLPRVFARPRALQQVLMNLVLNAADAVSEIDDPDIRIRTHANGETCLFEVADNGCGVDESEHERIFDPFFTTKPAGRGTGLGLPISRDLLAAHGGTLICEPRAEGGTAFIARMRNADSRAN